MSDRSTRTYAPHDALLEAFRAQQRTLEDNWSSWTRAWQSGWQTPDARSPADTETAPAEGDPRDSAPGGAAAGAARAMLLGPAEWHVRVARDTVEMIGALSRALSGADAGGGTGGWAGIDPEALVRAFAAPWVVMSGDAASGGGTALLERWLGIPFRIGPPGVAGDGRPDGNAWDELARLVGGASRRVSLGPIEPELARRSAELSETALACIAALQRYETLHLGALGRITARFVGELSGGDDGRDPPDSLRGLFERWIECGDRVLLDMYRSDDYLAVQSELLESLMRYRAQWQGLQDLFARLGGRPTREELDDAHRAVHELRRELRAQRREHRELTAAVAALAEARTAAPRKRAAAKGTAAKKTAAKKTG